MNVSVIWSSAPRRDVSETSLQRPEPRQRFHLCSQRPPRISSQPREGLHKGTRVRLPADLRPAKNLHAVHSYRARQTYRPANTRDRNDKRRSVPTTSQPGGLEGQVGKGHYGRVFRMPEVCGQNSTDIMIYPTIPILSSVQCISGYTYGLDLLIFSGKNSTSKHTNHFMI